MVRLQGAERGFALALIVSAAIHAALLPLFLSFTSGSAPRHAQPFREICIEAFLVPGTLVAGKTEALPGRKRREVGRVAPVAAAPLREHPEKVTPAEKEGKDLPADIRPPAEWSGLARDMGALPAPVSPTPAVLIPEGGDPSESNGAGISAARRGGGEFSRGNGAGAPASRREGMGKTLQAGKDVQLPKDADAVPRYSDNALPAYPPLARLRGYQGVAVLFVEVLADGRVGQVGIRRSTGHEILDRTALEAVRTWRFEPGRREGRAVTMSVAVPVRFVLKGNSVR
jgi:TonB family protein